MSTEMRVFIRAWAWGGGGGGGKGDERVKAQLQVPNWKTKNTMDRRQNKKKIRQCLLAMCSN